MIKEIIDSKEINEFIDENKYQNVYLYIDFYSYGVKNTNVNTYGIYTNSDLNAIIYEYYDSAQVIEIKPLNEVLLNEVTSFLIEKKYKRITGPTSLLNLLHLKIHIYKKTDGFIMKYSKSYNELSSISQLATAADLDEISDLILSDDRVGNSYTKEILHKQLVSRFENYNCENMVIRKDGKIISHIATYAVLDDIAVISGVITLKYYRNHGYGKTLVSDFSNYILKKKIVPIIYCYEDDLVEWYKKIGYVIVSTSSKLELI